jgi:hypothetical protein
VVPDADAAGDKGRQHIANLHAYAGRVKAIPPPEINGAYAHYLTDFWKAGGNLRSWVAGHVAEVLDEVFKQATACPPNYTRERWRRIAAWVRQESGFKIP